MLMNVVHSLEPGETPSKHSLEPGETPSYSASPGSNLCTTFLNIATHGEIMTKINLPETECNCTETGNIFNLIMGMTVCMFQVSQK